MSLVRLNEELEKAHRMACDSERVSRQLGDKSVLARSLNTKAFVLWQMNQIRESLAACVSSMKIAKENKIDLWIENNKLILPPLILGQIQGLLDMMLQQPGEIKSAWRELEEAASLIDNTEVSSAMDKMRPLFSKFG